MSQIKVGFVEPMLLLRAERLPDGPEWLYELKLDGYRALAIKAGDRVQLRSRNDNDFSLRYPAVTKALAALPNETVIDGELVVLDEAGRPSFNLLQNCGSSGPTVYYFAFDLIALAGKDVTGEPLRRRRELLLNHVLSGLDEPIRHSPTLDASLSDLVASVRAQGLEGLVAKRRDSLYEIGQRTGAWQKMRINKGQEFVIGGYTIGANGFDALVIGYYEGDQLIYVARTRNGFTPLLRQTLTTMFRRLEIPACPFTNLPEAKGGRWGQGMTLAKMEDCRWLRPELVGQFEFTEWTPDSHLRHSRFVALREDRNIKDVRRDR